MAYHWTNKEQTLGFNDGRKVVVGETLAVPDPTRAVICCRYGMHSSERVIDALTYAPGCTLFEVSHPSGIVQEQHDKQVGPDRKAEYCYGDLTDIAVVFARWCAVRAQRHAAAADVWAAARAVDAADVVDAAARDAVAGRAAAEYAARAAARAARAAADAAAYAYVYAEDAARSAADAAAADAAAFAAHVARAAAADAAETEAQEQWWQDYLAAYRSCERGEA